MNPLQNEGRHEEGRSQGLFSRITFAQPVLIGGTGSFRNAGKSKFAQSKGAVF